jgi:hypothetical protein
MRIALGTNRYTDLVRGDQHAVDVLQRAEQIFIPLIVLAELRAIGRQPSSHSALNRPQSPSYVSEAFLGHGGQAPCRLQFHQDIAWRSRSHEIQVQLRPPPEAPPGAPYPQKAPIVPHTQPACHRADPAARRCWAPGHAGGQDMGRPGTWTRIARITSALVSASSTTAP